MDLDDEELKATRMMNGADRKGRINKMEQDIKDIELFIDFCRAPYNFEHESEEKSYKELSYKIEHLIKAYKELEEEIERQKEINTIINKENLDDKYEEALEKVMTKFLNNNIENYYIPKSLVEEKIEELIKEGRHYNANKIAVLQELLEKRKSKC